MRTPFFAANWKMYKTVTEAVAYAREFATRARRMEGVDLAIAPPFTAIAATAEVLHHSAVGVAAQNIATEREGAFTGEVSGVMIRDAGADYVIVGHSERRRMFGDTDELVNKKFHAARGANLTPIVCVGETSDERTAGETFDVLDRQLRAGLQGVAGDDLTDLIIAYEPVWAIGTGRNATCPEAEEAHRHVRLRISEWHGAAVADRCRIIYGGSVKPDNIAPLMALADVDGALVGGASLDVQTFTEIIAEGRRSLTR